MKNKNEIVADDACIHCGLSEKDHCEFKAQTKPKGCKCDWLTWGKEPGPICNEYDGDGESKCGNCEHDKECHE